MAFIQKNFGPVGNTSHPVSGVTGPGASIKGAPSIWAYTTEDAPAAVNTSGYFNDISTILNIGDWIMGTCGAASGGTLAPNIFIVLSNAGGVVDVSNGEPITVSDTD